jgi:hypothetical protein
MINDFNNGDFKCKETIALLRGRPDGLITSASPNSTWIENENEDDRECFQP